MYTAYRQFTPFLPPSFLNILPYCPGSVCLWTAGKSKEVGGTYYDRIHEKCKLQNPLLICFEKLACLSRMTEKWYCTEKNLL